MKTSLVIACAVSTLIAGVALPAAAQTGGAAQSPSSVTTPLAPLPDVQPADDQRSGQTVTRSESVQGEPSVQRTVTEDKRTRIDELKVRGQTRRITVTPKQAKGLQYEILSDDSTGLGDSSAAQTPHGNQGRRVWNVLNF